MPGVLSVIDVGFHLAMDMHSELTTQRQVTPNKKMKKDAHQVVTHQPAISFSNSSQFPFNRAGGRTFNVR
jgi:hypothetical protein